MKKKHLLIITSVILVLIIAIFAWILKENLSGAFVGSSYEKSYEDISSYPVYDFAGRYKEGVIAVSNQNGEMGFVDENNNVIIPFKYSFDLNSYFSEGLAPVNLDGKWGYINKKDETVIPFLFEEAYSFKNNSAAIMINGKYGLIDINGNLITSLEYDTIDVDTSVDNSYIVSKDAKYGLLNSRGNLVIPTIYDELVNRYDISSTEKYLVAKKDGFYGVVDTNGDILIPFEYELINVGSDNSVITKKDNKYSVTGLNGKIIIPPTEEQIMPLRYGFYTKGGIFSGGTSIYNEEGKEIAKKGVYTASIAYEERYIVAIDKATSNTGILDFNGEPLSDFSYKAFIPLNDGRSMCVKNGKVGIWDNGKEKYIKEDINNIFGVDKDGNIYAQNSENGIIYILSEDMEVIKIFKGQAIEIIDSSYLITTDSFNYIIVPTDN